MVATRGSVEFIDEVTADRSRKINSEVYMDILSAHIQLNAIKLIAQSFTMQMVIKPIHTAKETQSI